MASVMLTLMPSDWVQVDSSVKPAPVSPSLVSIIMALVHSLTPLASVMLTLMPMVMAMAMELPVTGEAESPTATDLHRALMASVMPTLMPMVMAMAVALPVIGEAESPTATGP